MYSSHRHKEGGEGGVIFPMCCCVNYLASIRNLPSRDKFISVEKTSSDFRGSILGNLCGSFVGHNLECDFASLIQSLFCQEQSKF